MKNVARAMSFRALAGWTVIEILIGLAAIALIIMVGVPSINSLSNQFYLKSTSSNLLSSLTLAQKEAARRGSITRLCPSSDGNSCRRDGDWNRGWIVYVDTDANDAPEPVEIIDKYGPPRGKVHIDASGGLVSSAAFSLEGLLVENDHPTSGRFRICYGDEQPGFREIRIDARGRAEGRKFDQDCK